MTRNKLDAYINLLYDRYTAYTNWYGISMHFGTLLAQSIINSRSTLPSTNKSIIIQCPAIICFILFYYMHQHQDHRDTDAEDAAPFMYTIQSLEQDQIQVSAVISIAEINLSGCKLFTSSCIVKHKWMTQTFPPPLSRSN